MPYLGRELTSGNYLKLDSLESQFNGSTTTFSLKSGGADFFPGSSLSLLVSIAGVILEADTSYTINNNEITFTTPASIPISIPNPPNSPFVSVCISLNSSGLM